MSLPKNTVAGVLERAWHKIATPERWIQGAERRVAMRRDGTRYLTHCSIGAIQAVRCDAALKSEAAEILAAAIDRNYGPFQQPETVIIAYNDGQDTEHEGIREVFKAAIAKAKENEPVAMDIKEIPDVETTHEPLVSPVPDKEVVSPAIPTIPAAPSLPATPAPPERVPA